MKYVQYVNKTINDIVSQADDVILFGQNISAGSCISGFTRNLQVKEGNLIINTPNSENTLCGIGFGAMLNGAHAVFLMKQLDFLLLGIDQLVNTYNFMRLRNPKGSFTIMPVIVDSGFEGPMASINNLGDFCSIARIPGFTVTNKSDVHSVIHRHLMAPGFRIIGVSQRLFKKELIEIETLEVNDDKTIFQYLDGEDATIVCFNFSLPNGLDLADQLKEKGLRASLFSVNAATPVVWDRLINNVKKTGRLVIIDDSKSKNYSCDNFIAEALRICKLDVQVVVKREEKNNFFWPNNDQLDMQEEEIIDQIVKSKENSYQVSKV